jgi:FkbM family methyltransferase
MKIWTFEELSAENERTARGLQYTIAERDRLKAALRVLNKSLQLSGQTVHAEIIDLLLSTTSEHYQDVFALLVNGAKRNGFFVEFGACDGMAVSNTVLLERKFDWKGILAEPARGWHEHLRKYRGSTIDTRCVTSMSGGRVQFLEAASLGTSSTRNDHVYLGEVGASYEVETVTLEDLLVQHNSPSVIDFLSVDTEGNEKEVFSGFDFDRYRFNFICVEEHEGITPEDSVVPILERGGYEQLLPRDSRPLPMQLSGVDRFFVPNGHPALNW